MADEICVSYIDKIEYKDKWVINEFTKFSHRGRSWESKAFTVDGINIYFEFFIMEFVRSIEKNSIKKVNAILSYRTDKITDPDKCGRILKLLVDEHNVEGDFEFKLHTQAPDDFQLGDGSGRSRGWCKFYAKNVLINELHLTIKIKLLRGAGKKFINHYKDVENKNCINLEKLLCNNEFNDVEFMIDGDIVKANKHILSAQSDVFFNMFNGDMREKKDNKVTLTDIKVDVFKQFVKYLYGGEIIISEDSLADYLYVAEKYNIQNLKLICEKKVFGSLNSENANAFYDLSCTYNLDDKIKEMAECYFSENL